MANRLYKEYIKVDPNFIPVFSKDSDKVYPDKWQSFYPHDSFKKILKDVVETLEKSSDLKDRSIWMSGAYGTGKTFASFVIKHILEDNMDSISPYFTQNKMDTLLARVKGIRSKGPILVVQRSASAGINSQDKFFNAIIESVRKAIKEAGLTYMGAESLSDKILYILKNPETSAFNFQGVFNKHRGKFMEYESTDGVIKDLEELDIEDKLPLLDTIIEVAADEGFNWSMSSDELVDWLDDIRRRNNLYAIFFIWDEFTEYFKNNQNNITGLQEIAQASSRINFYFLLITHSSTNQLIQDTEAEKIIEARFKIDIIELEENTAFTLLGNALHYEEALRGEWEKTQKTLWGDVKKGCMDIIKNKDLSVKDEDFQKLLPMHPYTSYLLKYIAKDVSSNERTIFQFLSADYSNEDERTNFKWFINNYGYEYGKWNYLTVDYLWDYFFNENNVDLDTPFIQTITHYNNFALICDDSENNEVGDRRRRVLKVTLLLTALQTQNGANAKTGAVSLMRPTMENIKACFAGTPQEMTVEQDLDFFESKGVFGRIENAKDILYVMTSASIDEDRMGKITEDTKRNITFEKLVKDPTYNIAKQFLPGDDYLKKRMKIVCVTPTNAVQEAEAMDVDTNYIPTFFMFAQNEADQGKIKASVHKIYEKIGNRCIVVDFSALPFTDDLYYRFIESKAKESYFSSIPNQSSQVQLAQKTAKDIINEWTKKLITTALFVYVSPEEVTQIIGGSNLRRKFKEINETFYGAGLEEVSQNNKLYADSGFKEIVAQIAMGKADVPSTYSYLRTVCDKLKEAGIWDNPKYWKDNPNHPVSKMKIVINKIVDQSFEKSSMFSLFDIWDALKKPPFGLMPNTGSVFILGFLLSEYADSNYYKRDANSNTISLNYINLSELIYGTVKNLPKAQGQYIVQQTPEQIEFCQITGEIFKIAEEKRDSIDDISKNINIYLTNNKYPLWAMQYFIKEELFGNKYCDSMINLTNLLCEFIKPLTKIDRDRTRVVQDIYQIYRQNEGIADEYKEILCAENMRSGMNYYIAQYKPELIQITDQLKLEPKEYLELLNEKLSDDSSYLWEIGDTNKQIDNLYIDLKLIYDIDKVLTPKQRTYPEARRALIDKLDIVKIPYELLKELKPEIVPIIDQFILIKNKSDFNKAEASSIIANLADDFVEFFNNQFGTFCKAIDCVMSNPVSEEEYNYLFDKVPSGMLFETTDKFSTTMYHEVESYRKSKKTHKMFNAWRKVTNNSPNPATWSKTMGIPILCLFTDDILIAQRAFDALNKSTSLPTDKDIDDAIKFLESGKLDVLKDKNKCEKKFLEFFAGKYSYVIESAEDIRDQIRSVAGSEVYDWFAKADICRDQVKKYATERYQLKYRSKAKEKIKHYTAEQAQVYLNKMIDEDPLFGIDILND